MINIKHDALLSSIKVFKTMSILIIIKHVLKKYKKYARFSPYYAIAFRVCYFFTRGSCRERFNDKLGNFLSRGFYRFP